MSDEALTSALRALAQHQETSVLLQRYALLGDERVLRLMHLGEEIALHIPNADRDLVQGKILSTGSFYERPLLDRIRQDFAVPDGKIIVDAGANIGNHCVYFSKFLKPSKVFAFEPQPHVFDVLERNLELNGLSNLVTSRKLALGAEAGKASMSRSRPDNLGMASFAEDGEGGFPLSRLDDEIAKADHRKVGFIKVDVEGNEGPLLAGATGILSKSRPMLWVEVLPRNKEAIDAQLAEFGYVSQSLNRANHIYLPQAH
ncbi:MAG: FkbM family methyltransferase [Pseudomonadota bacterium]